MSKYGFEFTGQPFINEHEAVACPTCGKAVRARGSGWYDLYLTHAHDGTPLAKGGYTCKEHLSDRRKEEIRGTSPHLANFESEKAWVDREQVEGPLPGPLESLLVTVAKAQCDPELAEGVRKVFEAHQQLEIEQYSPS